MSATVSPLAFRNGTAILPDRLLPNAAVICDAGRITAVGPARSVRVPPDAQIVDARGGFISPGFVDLHVHGGDGADFMDGTADAVRTANRAHARHGTTSIFPTTTTGSPAQLDAMLKACATVQREWTIADGATGAWDSRQAWGMPDWVEVGDEWWITYWGANSGPNTPMKPENRRGIGLAKIRKEGFVSLRAPEVGGVVITRLHKWPGGDLLVNADTGPGEMRVRISNKGRRAFDGFNFADCAPFTGNRVAHRVGWKDRRLDDLKGQDLRLEFYFSKQADLYSFRATGASSP